MGFLRRHKEENRNEVVEKNKSQDAQAMEESKNENAISKDANAKQTSETQKEAADVSGYQFAPGVKLKECKYCRVMIPKSAKICPNCKMHLKKSWLKKLLLLLILAALIAGGVYWYVFEYQGQTIAVMVTNPTAQATVSDNTEQAEAQQETAETTDGTESKTESAGQSDGTLAALQLSDDETDSSVKDNETLPEFPPIEGMTEKNMEEEPEFTQPEVTEEDICGADGPVLDYADGTTVIFHDYFGLFVYDREKEEISTAVDLEAIGCQYTQGDTACEVWAAADGSNVYLHPMKADEMYVLDVKEQTLTKQPYTEEEVEEEDMFALKQTKACVEADSTVFRSASCAELAKEKYLYLESGSGMALDLCYVVEQNNKVKERVYLLKEYVVQSGDTVNVKGNDRIEENGVAESVDGKAADKLLAEDSDADNENTEEMELPADAGESEPIDVSAYTEAEFRNICQKVSYKALLRLQDIYLNTGVTVEVTVVEQVDGGLFDDNIYYLCTAQEDGIQRYYIIRDDRTDDDWLILEGDVLRIYGQLFGSCKVPAQLVASQPTVPALTMSYYELLDE